MFEYDMPLTRAAQSVVEGRNARLSADAARQRLALGQLQVEDAQRQAQNAADYRAELARNPYVAPKNVENGGYTPAPIEDGTAALKEQLGLRPPDTRIEDATGLLKNVTGHPAFAQLSGSDKRLDAMLRDLGDNPPGEPNMSPAPAQPGPIHAAMQQQREAEAAPHTITTPEQNNPTQIAIKFWQQRDPQEAMKLQNQVLEHASKVSMATGNLADGTNIINNAFGTKYSAVKAANFDIMKDGDGNPMAILDKAKMAALTAQGTPLEQAYEQSMAKIQPGGGFTAFAAAVSQLAPEDQTLDNILQLGAGMNISHKIVKEVASEYQAKRNEEMRREGEDRKDERQAKQIAASDARQSRSLAAIAARQQDKPANGGLSQQALDDEAKKYNLTGKIEGYGRNKEAQAAIMNRAAELRGASGDSVENLVGRAGDLKAINASIQQQEKQVGSMGSFVKNIDKQVNRFEQISKYLGSYDARLLNVPLRALRGRVAGSPLQSKVDMYLTEISSETGKLASGATGSVAELSQGAREKWEKIHDPNLSMSDLLDVLKETRHAGQMRMDSVNEQLAETRRKRADLGKGGASPQGKGKPALSSFWK